VPYGEDGRLDMEPPVLVPLGQEKLPAVSIAEIAVKRQIEFPESLLASNSSDTLSPSPAAAGQRWDELRKATTRSMWEKLILLNKAHGRLDAGSIALLNAKQSGNSRYAEMNASVEVNAQMLVNFARSVVMESLRNEFLLHFRVLEYLGHAPSATLEEVNSYIYRDLFQIAIDDPYLGMRLPDVYGAMDDFIDTRSAPQTLLSAR
jgi:hypothetical protein